MVQTDSLVYYNNSGTVEYRQRNTSNIHIINQNKPQSLVVYYTMAKYVLSVLFEIYNMG